MVSAPGAFSLCDSADDDLHLSGWLMESSADWVLGGEERCTTAASLWMAEEQLRAAVK